jgi:DNA topoisomerase-1
MKLVILESPNKREKVSHCLGAGFEVLATAGHFRDLPERELGVDLNTFAPTYVVHEKRKDTLARIKAAAAKADEVILATDLDREGEAISWHLAQELRLKTPMRLRSNEITEKGLKAALAALSPLDQNLVDAQQARRVLDRLVGYQVSPQLRVFGQNHSAGRVQSATLHLVVTRELEREAFKPQDFWTLSTHYSNELVAHYAALDEDGKLVATRFATAAEAEAIAAKARAASHRVTDIKTAPKDRKPQAPFTTSSVLQAASSQLKLKPDATMALLQKLFEAGVISYHRTDSVALSDDAIQMARDFIGRDYPAALPDKAPTYKSKADAQAAHEAIRPTSLDPQPHLAGDEAALYDVIRRRFLACQSKPAVLSQTTVTIDADGTTWRAVGSVVQFDGFLHYLADSAPDDDDDSEPRLPKVAAGDVLTLSELEVAAKQTKPPPRYTQASLTKAMEQTGIGRPSTYANTLKTLFDRDYIAEEKAQLYPTPRGRLIDSMLGKAYPELLETDLTAQLESRLDEIADGKRRWLGEIRDWYGPFASQLAAAPGIFAKEVSSRPELAKLAPEAPKPSGQPCPQCGKELFLRKRPSGDGEYLTCSGYPACKYAANPDAKASGKKCPRCQRDLLVVKRQKDGGEYLSCSGYNLKDDKGHRACEYTTNLDSKASEHKCPKCSGPMEDLTGKFGPYARCLAANCSATLDLAPAVAEKCPVCDGPMKDKGSFLSCAGYPACKGSYDKEALAQALKNGAKCPDCGKPLLSKKGPKGPFTGCAAFPKCRYIQPSKPAAHVKGSTS